VRTDRGPDALLRRLLRRRHRGGHPAGGHPGLGARHQGLPLAWPAGTVVFKTRTLAEQGATPTADRRNIGIDLRDDWPKALRDSGFDPSRPTAWIAEGLLIYLPPDAQDRLLDKITVLSAPGSRLATEHMDVTGLTGDWAQKLTERARRLGSDINLAELFYSGDRNTAGEYLRAHGWRTEIRSTKEAFAANGFELPEDDMLAALAGDSGYLSAILG
jgi:O-methyltransferase involved in polyketide biosynthesis